MLYQQRIVLASVKKPIDDPRMYEKIGSSLASSFEVHIVGAASGADSLGNRCYFHQIPVQHASRTAALTFIFRKVMELKPSIWVVHTPELLGLALWYRFRFGGKIIYDIRENYWRNRIYQSHYTGIKKWIEALGIRTLERISLPWFHAVWVAELGYLSEMSFLPKNALVLENKYQPLKGILPKTTRRVSLPFTAIIVGTLSEPFGTLRGVRWVIAARQVGIPISLQIVGKAATQPVAQTLQKLAQQHSFIHLEGIESLVPHEKVMRELQKADLALLPYLPNKSTENCIPTKLYECMALRVPMLIQKNPLWEKVCNSHNAAIFTDFATENIHEVIEKIVKKTFYNDELVQEAYWATEAPKLHEKIHQLTTDNA